MRATEFNSIVGNTLAQVILGRGTLAGHVIMACFGVHGIEDAENKQRNNLLWLRIPRMALRELESVGVPFGVPLNPQYMELFAEGSRHALRVFFAKLERRPIFDASSHLAERFIKEAERILYIVTMHLISEGKTPQHLGVQVNVLQILRQPTP